MQSLSSIPLNLPVISYSYAVTLHERKCLRGEPLGNANPFVIACS